MNQLRRLMLEELHRRNFADTTVRTYLHSVAHFSQYFRRPPRSAWPIPLFMVNDIAIPAVHGEAFAEIGEHIGNDSLFDRVFMVTMLPDGVG